MADFVKTAHKQYIGHSTHTKPTGVPFASIAYEYDTRETFITYDGENWVLKDSILSRASSDLLIATGGLPGVTHINKFGRNPDCDKAVSSTAVNLGRSIWDGGIAGAVNWLAPTASRIHQLKSTNVNDTSGGTGARTVQIFGLDANFALFDETLTLNGTSNVATSSFTMIYRMIVRSAGSTGWNVGTLTATADTDGTITAQITIGNNQTLMTQFMVPADVKGYLTNFFATLKKKGGATKLSDIFLMSKKFGEVWRVRDSTAVVSDGTPYIPRKFSPYKTFQAKELVQIIANPSADGQDVSAGYDLIMVDD